MDARLAPLTRPLREEAGIEVVDAAEGVVQIDVTPELRNPAGTLQGAMVALVAEAAAEDLVATRFESPAVVTDLDLRTSGRPGSDRSARAAGCSATGPTPPSESSWSTPRPTRSRPWSTPGPSPFPDGPTVGSVEAWPNLMQPS